MTAHCGPLGVGVSSHMGSGSRPSSPHSLKLHLHTDVADSPKYLETEKRYGRSLLRNLYNVMVSVDRILWGGYIYNHEKSCFKLSIILQSNWTGCHVDLHWINKQYPLHITLEVLEACDYIDYNFYQIS